MISPYLVSCDEYRLSLPSRKVVSQKEQHIEFNSQPELCFKNNSFDSSCTFFFPTRKRIQAFYLNQLGGRQSGDFLKFSFLRTHTHSHLCTHAPLRKRCHFIRTPCIHASGCLIYGGGLRETFRERLELPCSGFGRGFFSW
jgi:hypothetical protein